jgi:hypothetical protein
MSDPTASAPPRNPHWLLWEPDLLPMTDPPRPRLTPEPERAPRAEAPSPRARATMPPAARSGYAEIIAARTVLRARARLAVAEERHQTFGLQEVRTAPAATPAPERLPRPKWHRLGVPALAVSGALAAPACVVLAFAWIGSPRPPAAPGPARPEAPGIQTAAPRSADGERLALPAGTPPAVQRAESAEPGATGDHASSPGAPVGTGDGQPPAPAEGASALAAQGTGIPPRATDTEPEPPPESVSSPPAPNGLTAGSEVPFAEEEPVFAAWEQVPSSHAAGAEPMAPPGGAPSDPATAPAESEARPVAVEEGGPASAIRDQDDPAPPTDTASGTADEGAPASAAAAVAADSPSVLAIGAAPGTADEGAPARTTAASDALRAEAVAEAVPGGAPFSVPPVADAGAAEAPAREGEARVPALAGLPGWEPTAPPVAPLPAPVAETRPDGALAAAPVARPASPVPDMPAADPGAATPPAAPSGTGTAANAAPPESSGGAGPSKGRAEAALVAPAPATALPPGNGAPPAKLRPGGKPAPQPPSGTRVAARDAPPASPPLASRCRAIILKAQLGEETDNAERMLLRSGCGARR